MKIPKILLHGCRHPFVLCAGYMPRIPVFQTSWLYSLFLILNIVISRNTDKKINEKSITYVLLNETWLKPEHDESFTPYWITTVVYNATVFIMA